MNQSGPEQINYGRAQHFIKIGRMMKLTTFLLLVGCLEVSATAYSQKATITLSLHKVSLEKVFEAVTRQSGYLFLYSNERLPGAGEEVSVEITDGTIAQVMDACLAGLPLSYRVMHQTIVIIPKEDGPTAVPKAVPVSGFVRDSSGRPLIGVSVQVKGSGTGTVTDAAGHFELQAPGDAVLLFSYVGYRPVSAPVSGTAPMNIVLHGSVGRLSQLVVVGYGTQKKENISGAIGTYRPTALTARPAISPDQMMQGRMAGVNVTYGSGTPGGAMHVSIRGTGSISASNDPLYVIDGVPVYLPDAELSNFGEQMNPLAELNPDDIESIDVLKDAAAAAIYGSRATNGVVIITTKSGQRGKPMLSVDLYTGIQSVPRLDKLQMAPSDLYVEVINEAIDNYNMQNGYMPGSTNYAKRIQDPYPGLPDVNWLDLVLRTAHTSNANLSFSGGTDKGTYYMSGGYLDQQGAVITNRLKRYNGRINLTRNIFPWLKVGANTNFSFSNNNRVPGSNVGSAIMARSLEQRPFDRPYKPDGSYYVGGTEELMRNNAVQVLNEERSYVNNSQFLGNFYADISFLKHFTFKSSFGTNVIFTHDYLYYMKDHPYSTGNGRIVDRRRNISNILFENTLDYANHFGPLDLKVLGGHSFQKITFTNSSVDGRDFPSPSFDVLSVAGEITDAYTDLNASALESYFGRANFS